MTKVNNIIKLKPPAPSAAFNSYWRFAQKRQQAFFARVEGQAGPWSDDDIINQYKFTNAYRASDRVSQYLIRHVIYPDNHDEIDFSAKDILLRILLFKIFNKISTWQLLEQHFGVINCANFDVERFDQVLDTAINSGQRIYSAAYIMPSGNQKKYGKIRKHRFHLQLIEHLLRSNLQRHLQQCPTMAAGYQQLLKIDSFGKFLAYQLITDINYSELTNFSEMEFVMAGPGALDGIRKCFTDLHQYSTSDTIKWMADNQQQQFERLDLDFPSLFGRDLQLIDCQNLFCEVDKYCRVAHPDIQGISGRTRIKQTFKPKSQPIELFYPPKWQLNSRH